MASERPYVRAERSARSVWPKRATAAVQLSTADATPAPRPANVALQTGRHAVARSAPAPAPKPAIHDTAQPRRLAARAVASRIAEELGQAPGQSVGYQVRFKDQDHIVACMPFAVISALRVSLRGRNYPGLWLSRLVARDASTVLDDPHWRRLRDCQLLGDATWGLLIVLACLLLLLGASAE